MRLDAYLVEMGIFRSRGRSKKAIIGGKVKVNGVVVSKPSKDISNESDVDVEEGLDKPQGYFKLKRIQEASDLIGEKDHVLDLGSSAGGFIMFASEIAADVKGVEFSHEFRSDLGQIAHKRDNVSVMFGDVFILSLSSMSPQQVDVILNDMTLDPEAALDALERILPLLKENGKVLQVIKMGDRRGNGRNDRQPLLDRMEDMGLSVLDVIESTKQEIYVIARKGIARRTINDDGLMLLK